MVDGTGNPAFYADVAIKDGRIVAVGRYLASGKKELDASGQIVAPGFIDVHTHAENVVELPRAENYIRMGVTSIVVGNCGGSVRDVSDFFKKVDGKVTVNVATLVGHNTVREAAMGGSFDRAPTPKELAKMEQMVDGAMREGACGLSTGLLYLPGTFAKTNEIVALAKVAGRYDGIYATHMRNESDEILKALDETFAVAKGANVRCEVSHLKLGKAGWGKTDEVVQALEDARKRGLDVTEDQYVYTASSTTMAQVIPSWAREGGRSQFRDRLKNPDLKAKMVAEMKENLRLRNDQDYAYAVIASYGKDKSLNGLNVPQATQKVKGTDDLDAQIEFLFEMEASGGASGVFFGMNEDDLKRFMSLPNTMFAADGSCRDFGKDVPHPRSYGNNARVLGRYVRELGVLKLEDAIRKMTSLPATTFRLRDRGQLRVGAWADVAVFDPLTVADKATYDDPHHYAVGFKHVIVNGVPVILNGEFTKAKPGRALRHEKDSKIGA